MSISTSETQSESVKCESCGFTEECTTEYISKIRESYNGNWICGLCVEAVKDEVVRSERVISTEEALSRHVDFCKRFRSDENIVEHPIFVIGRILRRTLESRSTPNTPTNPASSLFRSESCVIMK